MTIHRGLRGWCSQPLPESSLSLAISPDLIATRRTQRQFESGSRIARRARLPFSQPLQRTTNTSFQLALVAAWRHTQSQDRVRSALLLAAERRSVGRQDRGKLGRGRSDHRTRRAPVALHAGRRQILSSADFRARWESRGDRRRLGGPLRLSARRA